MNLRRAAALTLAGVALFAKTANRTGVALGADTTVFACIKKSDGAARIVGLSGHCRDSESPIQWNVSGTQGPTGPTGPQGALMGWYLMIPPVSELPSIDDGTIHSALVNAWGGHVYPNSATLHQAMSTMSSGDEEPAVSSTWITMWSFDTLDACESAMGKAIHGFDAIRDKKLSELSPSVAQRAIRFAASNCISTDDSRLKEK